jgi:hypothetical protein
MIPLPVLVKHSTAFGVPPGHAARGYVTSSGVSIASLPVFAAPALEPAESPTAVGGERTTITSRASRIATPGLSSIAGKK